MERDREDGSDWAALYRDHDTATGYTDRYRGLRRDWNNRRVGRVVLSALEELGDGRFPDLVIDAPAGTGRFSEAIAARGGRLLHLDLSPTMLRSLRARHGAGWEVVGDLNRPPIRSERAGVVLCLRLMQHLRRHERIEALRGLARIAPRALVAYYPGWHYKDRLRRLRHRSGLPHRTLREHLEPDQLREEAELGGWNLRRTRRVLPMFSENVLLLLDAAHPEAGQSPPGT